MEQLDPIRALTRGETAFTTLQLVCVAAYDASKLQRVQAPAGNIAAGRGHSGPERFQHGWRIWWRRPDHWRDDIVWQNGQSAVCVVSPSPSISRVPALGAPPASPNQPTLADRLAHMPLAQPLGLARGWTLTVIGPGAQAGRATLRVHAVRGAGAGRFGMWSHVNEHVVDVDAERGVLLRTAAIIDGEEVSVVAAQSVRFDESIPDTVFRSKLG